MKKLFFTKETVPERKWMVTMMVFRVNSNLTADYMMAG